MMSQNDSIREEKQYRLYRRHLIKMALGTAVFLNAMIVMAYVFSALVGKSLPPLTFNSYTGLIGVLTAPLSHVSKEHLVSNVVFLAVGVYYAVRATGVHRFFLSLPLLWTLPQLITWLVVDEPGAILVGASGVVCSVSGYALLGLLHKERYRLDILPLVIAPAMLIGTSFFVESMLISVHVAGFIIGLVIGYFAYQGTPPLFPPQKESHGQD